MGYMDIMMMYYMVIYIMNGYMIILPVWDDPVILRVKEEYSNIDHLKTTIFGEE